MTAPPLLLALLLSAASEPDQPAVARPSAVSRVALWVSPLFSADAALSGGLGLAVGAEVPIADWVAVSLEGSFSSLTVDCSNVEPPVQPGDCPNEPTFALGGGPTFFFTGPAPTGFFFHPKLMVAFARRENYSVNGIARLASGQQWQWAIEPGIDLGYAWKLGPVYVALQLGAGVGLGYQSGVTSTFGLMGIDLRPHLLGDTPRLTPVLDLDLNLVHLGVAF